MRRLAFWAVVFLLSAVITHLAYVLFGPRYQMASLMRQTVAMAPLNSLAVLDKAQQRVLFPDDSGAELRAVCPFDLSTGDLTLKAMMPDTQWAIAVYSSRGELIYSLTRQQAGVLDAAIAIIPARSLVELVQPREKDAIFNDGWKLESASITGLAVIWAVLANPLDDMRYRAQLTASSCAIKTPG